MINSNVFNYINVMGKTADAAWIRNEAIANNIANVDTPGFKRQDINFEGELKRALKNSRYQTLDSKVANLHMNRLNPRTFTDNTSYSYRMDGNNVDIDTENVMLASNQLKYNAVMTSVNAEFSNLNMVTK